MTHTVRRYTKKHGGHDHHSPGNHVRAKRHGSGSFNWGKKGDGYKTIYALDKGDPMYDDDVHKTWSKAHSQLIPNHDKLRVVHAH
eukprot:gene10996-3068_t